jgi:hypothetical protein
LDVLVKIVRAFGAGGLLKMTKTKKQIPRGNDRKRSNGNCNDKGTADSPTGNDKKKGKCKSKGKFNSVC